MDTSKKHVKQFKGLNNVSDPLRLSLESFVQADNVDITDTAGLVRCNGFTQTTTNFAISGAYATRDQKRLYVIDTGELRQMHADMTHTVLKTGLSANKTWFDEINGVVYYANGVDYGSIEPGGWHQWGIEAPTTSPVLAGIAGTGRDVYQAVCTYVDARGQESGSGPVAVFEGTGPISVASVPTQAGYTTNTYITKDNGTVFFLNGDGRELPYWASDTPRGTIVAGFEGRMYIAEAYPQYDSTAIWSSLPLQYHHFEYGGEGLMVPGTVRMMKAADKALIIGTDRQIFAYDGDKLEELADYGVVAGWHASRLGSDLYFWSLRGLCSVLPFKNLTEETVSVPPGSNAGALVLEKDGMRRYVVALRTDGQAYNRR